MRRDDVGGKIAGNDTQQIYFKMQLRKEKYRENCFAFSIFPLPSMHFSLLLLLLPLLRALLFINFNNLALTVVHEERKTTFERGR